MMKENKHDQNAYLEKAYKGDPYTAKPNHNDLNYCQTGDFLLVSEGHHGVNVRCTARREIRGGKRDAR
jgi:hypothetical protein